MSIFIVMLRRQLKNVFSKMILISIHVILHVGNYYRAEVFLGTVQGLWSFRLNLPQINTDILIII